MSAAAAGVAIPRIREFDLDANPAWVIFDALPGVPVPEAGDAALEGPRFPAMARSMGELLATFRALPTEGLEIDDLWAEPERLPLAPRVGLGRSRPWPIRSAARWPASSMASLPSSGNGRRFSLTATSPR